MKIARIATVPIACLHIENQIKRHVERGAELYLIVSPNQYYDKELKNSTKIPIIHLEIPRKINLINDLRALLKLILIFRKYKFDIVHSKTPKGGLLVAIAGFIARTPVRIHTFTGQRWITVKEPLKSILKLCDKIINLLNTWNYTDGPAQTNFLINEKIVSKNKVSYLHKGSVGGIDFERFNLNLYQGQREKLKKELGISPSTTLILYAGRIAKDKGIEELAASFRSLQNQGKDVALVILGASEQSLDPISNEVYNYMQESSDIIFLGFQPNTEYYLAGADIFCLPSYREGFAVIILEAMAMGAPVIGSDIPGINDIISHKQTGLLTPVKDSNLLTDSILQLINNNELKKQIEKNAEAYVKESFDHKLISDLLWDDYQKFLSK